MPACARPGTYIPRQTHDCDAAVLVRRHLPGFLARLEESGQGPLPEFVKADVASRIRTRAAEQASVGDMTFADFQQIDEICDRVNATAHKLDAKVLSLALDGLEEPLGRIEAATASLDTARERLEKLKSAIEVSTKLLLAILSVAALVVDPTRISSLAAATAIASLASTIAEAAADP